MQKHLKIRIIDLSNNKEIIKLIEEGFAKWGYTVFSDSGEKSTECDAIITVTKEKDKGAILFCHIQKGENVQKFEGNDPDEFAITIVNTLFRMDLDVHQLTKT